MNTILGRGGYATVYLGHYRALNSSEDKPVAVKMWYYPDCCEHEIKFDEILKTKPSCQPYVIKMIACSIDFALMELMSGGTLYNKIEKTGKLVGLNLLQTTLQIATALGALHHSGIIHLDIKGGNIFFGEHGQVKLGDFGLATVADTLLDKPHTGVPTYMAPEMNGYDVKAIDKSDIFSFGIVLLEMYVGLAIHDIVAGKRSKKRQLSFHSFFPDLDTWSSYSSPHAAAAASPATKLGQLKETVEALKLTCPKGYLDLIWQCVSLEPSERPTAIAVSDRLKLLIAEHKEAAAPGEFKEVAAGAQPAVAAAFCCSANSRCGHVSPPAASVTRKAP